jgi:hypothetical protein
VSGLNPGWLMLLESQRFDHYFSRSGGRFPITLDIISQPTFFSEFMFSF